MYVNPFWAGVAACILTEVAILITVCIVVAIRTNKALK